MRGVPAGQSELAVLASLFLPGFSLVTLTALGTWGGARIRLSMVSQSDPGEALRLPSRIEFHFPPAPSTPFPHPTPTHTCTIKRVCL